MSPNDTTQGRRRYLPAVGPQLKRLLAGVFGLFALLAVNSSYLVSVTVFEWITGETYQNWFYLVMFLIHLVLGALIIVPLVAFGLIHMRNTLSRPNRRAVYVGIGLFIVALALLASGIVLTRIEGVIVVNNPTVRAVAYWTHVITPLVAAWLFVLHRLAGKRIRWQIGVRWTVVAAVFAGIMLIVQAQDPRRWDLEGPDSGEQYFFPSLARTATGDFIPPRVLMNEQYCKECHEDSFKTWEASMHRFSSFNKATSSSGEVSITSTPSSRSSMRIAMDSRWSNISRKRGSQLRIRPPPSIKAAICRTCSRSESTRSGSVVVVRVRTPSAIISTWRSMLL